MDIIHEGWIHIGEEKSENQTELPRPCCISSPGEYFDDSIPPAADDPTAVAAPDDGADTFTAHESMAGDLLGAASFFEVPESETSVVAGGDQFTAIG